MAMTDPLVVMSEAPGVSGAAVLLAGQAEPALLDAVSEAFRVAGARVEALDRPETDREGPSAVVREVVARLGGLQVCVIFCRAPARSALSESDPVSWSAALDAVLGGAARLGLAVAQTMAQQGGGSVVFVGSVDAVHAYPGRSVASVAMSGLLGLARAMGVELAGAGVRVNVVIAGPLGGASGEPPADADPDLVERTRLRSPVGRWATSAEIAAAVRFVAGPDAGFMTGQSLRVDGGWASLNQAPAGMRFP